MSLYNLKIDFSLASAIIMSIVYSIEVEYDNDPYVEIAERAMHTVTPAVAPGAFLVDSIPALKYVPNWFPGIPDQRNISSSG